MKRIVLKAILFVTISFMVFIVILNASLKNNRNDKMYIEYFLRDWKMTGALPVVHNSFDNQIAFISRLQDSTLVQFENGEIAPENSASIEYLYSNRKGLCFNRSFLQEKILRYAGFKTRHLYVYFSEDSAETKTEDVFNRRLMSHAMFEVKTKKGWMVVGTNGNWMALDKSGNPMTLGVVREKLMNNTLSLAKSPTKGVMFFNQLPVKHNFKFLYGVYSRHGGYLESGPAEQFLQRSALRRGLPDYNLQEFLYNL